MSSLFDTILNESFLSNKGTSKQKKILEAAIKLFAEKGYSNTSTSEIAKEAGIAEGTLFRYYKTKEVLLQSILIPCKNNLIPKVSSEFIEIIKMQTFKNSEELLRFIVKNRLAYLKENHLIFVIFIKEAIYRDDYRNECLPHLNKQILHFAYEILDSAKKRGEIKDIPNGVILRIISTILGGYFISRFIILPEEMFMSDEKEVNLLVNSIMSGIGNKT